MANILVSIITTVKNGEVFIEETLQSVYNQTFKNYEHIIIDDGSTDNTVSIINDFKQANPENKIILHEPGSLGRGKALNFGVAKAKGQWIAIVDADDIWHPNKLEAQMNILKENPGLSVLAAKTGLFTNKVNFKNFKNFTYQKIIPKKMLYKSIISHSSVIIKKEDAIYDEERTSQFDAELWYRLAFDNKKQLAIMPQELNFHRIHKNQSFEASKGQAYQMNSIKLSSKYCLKSIVLLPLFLYFIKFMYRLLIPRSIRFSKVVE
ncbi:glycosyltransferase family 2 protein [Polaribacter sp. IC073]|uniref:glycosyltransferase family 2 protein n=1 Tax=Polaribacter sp. IC073 TaxID=2508540 RepID=UPI0011BE292D|nr:glycosyltransferase family A protein [Polaribacter sp. IC073]TXD48921.1 glycosyltransferase family 2 protein [Polaribacter sp. IC073]